MYTPSKYTDVKALLTDLLSKKHCICKNRPQTWNIYFFNSFLVRYHDSEKTARDCIIFFNLKNILGVISLHKIFECEKYNFKRQEMKSALVKNKRLRM